MMEDKIGAPLLVVRDVLESAFVAVLSQERLIPGRALFIDRGDERIFFHTEVADEYGGRGIASVLVQEALAVTAAESKTVVPLCPLVKSYLDKHGEDFVASGGAYRRPSTSDIQFVQGVLG
ncbi:GNAT family N-acetyltransferase [Corynebacterium rouxii]|uniref:GNAT family N-acetyltransferase n=1 Tax=Corynebacterium rouxii TaxID=2719119 RepID=UPI00313EAE8C